MMFAFFKLYMLWNKPESGEILYSFMAWNQLYKSLYMAYKGASFLGVINVKYVEVRYVQVISLTAPLHSL